AATPPQGIKVHPPFLSMARKPSPHQPLLPFPADADDPPIPDDTVSPHPEGGQHAVQDDGSRTPPEPPAAARPAPQEPDAAARGEPPGDRAEGPPPSLEGATGPGEAGQRPGPDRQRSAGDRPLGPAGLFALRVAGRG